MKGKGFNSNIYLGGPGARNILWPPPPPPELFRQGFFSSLLFSFEEELEDEVQELGLSFGELSHQLAVARSEANSTLHSLNAKIKELEDVKDNAQVESQMANHKHKQVII